MKARLTTILITLITMLLGAMVASAQDDACFETGGFWNAEESRCNISTGLQIDIDYPVAPEGADFVSATIRDFVQGMQTETIQQFAEWYDPTFLTFGWSLGIDYEEFQYSDNIISYNFSVYTYTGGAHGNINYQTYTFDLENGTEVTYEDLFQADVNELAVISPIVQQALNEHLGEMTDAQWIEDGTGENPDNYQNFILTDGALIFYFDPYQVAAYAAGPQMVSIPLVDLAEVLAPEFRGE
jgi:peptidoglycan-N-acetylglucosamine deacetylase